MKRKIMVTLDGSDLSKKVFPAIQKLFQPAETELILLQVIDPLTYTPYVTPMAPSLTWDPQLLEHEWVEHRRAVVEEINDIAHELESDGFHIRVYIPVGDPIQEIRSLAFEEQIDLLAMATHGRTGIMRMLMGSVVEGVLRSLSIPMLLIRPEDTNNQEHPREGTEKNVKARNSEVVYETPSV